LAETVGILYNICDVKAEILTQVTEN